MAAKENKEPVVLNEAPADRTVRVRLPKENPQQEDMVVWVNETRYIIKRGVYVDVPLAVAEVLEHAERMEEKAMTFAESIGKHGN